MVALPGEANAQVAEAWGGARGALQLLRKLRGPERCARVIGDSLAVVKYGAEKGLLRHPRMQSVMAHELAGALEAGWQLTWKAVRRRLNKAADEVFTTKKIHSKTP